MKSRFFTIAPNVALQILSNLNESELFNLSNVSVSNRFKELSKNNLLWKKIIAHHFWITEDQLQLPLLQGIQFQVVYKNLKRAHSLSFPINTLHLSTYQLMAFSEMNPVFIKAFNHFPKHRRDLFELACLLGVENNIRYLFEHFVSYKPETSKLLAQVAFSGIVSSFDFVVDKIKPSKAFWQNDGIDILIAAAEGGNYQMFQHCFSQFSDTLSRKLQLEILEAALRGGSVSIIDDCILKLRIVLQPGHAEPFQFLTAAFKSGKLATLQHCIQLFEISDETLVKYAQKYRIIIIYYSAFYGTKEMLDFCIKKFRIDPAQKDNDYGWNALDYSIQSGDKDKIQFCLTELKMDPKQTDQFGCHSMHASVITGNKTAVDFCVANFRVEPQVKLDERTVFRLYSLAMTRGGEDFAEYFCEK